MYNGNIASMMVSIPRLSNTAGGGTNGAGQMVYGYRYDQLNRIVGMNAYRGFNNANNTFTPATTQDYAERISYDPNGNILSYLRNGTTLAYGAPPRSHPVDMDDLHYNYTPNTNQLDFVLDDAASTNYTKDIDDQGTNNYAYDAIGNMIKDDAAGITSVTWTVYGKIQTIVKSSGTISYTYDASGNRISKTAAGKTTVYVRDAQGNVMSVYETTASNSYEQKELHLYGSSRIGMIADLNLNKIADISSGITGYTVKLTTVTRGSKVYELSNHLGNVLVTVTDRKVPVVNTAGTAIEYYTADVQTATDYAPFGMALVGRKVSTSKYRYGFNGQEHSTEIGDDDYTAHFWEYDSRIGRRWNMDPKPTFGISEYGCFENNPIQKSDLHGDVPDITINGSNNSSLTIKTTAVNATIDLDDYWIEHDFHGQQTINLGSYSRLPDAFGLDIGGALTSPIGSVQLGVNILWHTRGEKESDKYYPEVHTYTGVGFSFKGGVEASANVGVFAAWANNADGTQASEEYVANGMNWTGNFWSGSMSAGKAVYSLGCSVFTARDPNVKAEGPAWTGVELAWTPNIRKGNGGQSLFPDLDKINSMLWGAALSKTYYYMVYGNGSDFLDKGTTSKYDDEDVSGWNIWNPKDPSDNK